MPPSFSRSSLRVPLLLVLGISCLALSPALFKSRIPAQTNLVDYYGPWWARRVVKETISGGDSFFVYLPDRLAAVREWKAGRLPLWNPHVGGGMPMLGMQTANPLDPSIALHLVFPLGRAMGITYVILLFVAGMGMVLFLRARGLLHPGALATAGIAFALNPYFLAWLDLRVFLGGLATLPLCLWALDDLTLGARRPRCAGTLALGLGYAVLAGTLQTATFFLGILGIRIVWNAIVAAREVRPRFRSYRFLFTALVLGLGVGILPLTAGLELLNHSVRLDPQRGFYGDANFLPWRAIGLWINPDLFGRVESMQSPFWNVLRRTTASGSGWGALGILPLFLAMLALFRRSGPRSERLFWGGLCGLTLSFLLLLQTPFDRFVHGLWPTMGSFDLLRGLFLVNLGGAILAGWGAQELMRIWSAEPRRTWILQLAAYMLAGFLIVILARQGLPEALSLPRAILPLCLACIALLGVGWLREPAADSSRRGWLVAVLVAFELSRMHFMTNTFSDPQSAYPAPRVLDSMRATLGPPDYSRFIVFGHMRIFPPNVASVFELSDLRSYTNVPIARFRSLLEWAEGTAMGNQEFVSKVDSPIYRLLGVRYLFSQPKIAQQCYLPAALPDFPVNYFRRTDALPRAFLVHEVTRVTDRDALGRALQDPAFDPARQVFLVGNVGGAIACAPAEGVDRVEIRSRLPVCDVIDVRTDAPGVLVLSDAFYPGWKARVNERNVEIIPAYGGLRGIAVPAGQSRVVMTYRPGWLWPGVAITLAALILAVWLLVEKPVGRRPRLRGANA